MENVTMFVNDKVRYHTCNVRIYSLLVAIVLCVMGIVALYYSIKDYLGKVKLQKEKRRQDVEEGDEEVIIQNNTGNGDNDIADVDAPDVENIQVNVHNAPDDDDAILPLERLEANDNDDVRLLDDHDKIINNSS